MSDIVTGFNDSTGTDIAGPLVDKSYLIDRYPELVDTFRFAGLWAWGFGSEGQLGDGTGSTSQNSPVQTVAAGTNWKSSSVHQLAVAIKTDGTLWTWGSNASGGLGDGSSITHRSSPIQTVSGGTNWKQVSAGGGAVGTIKTDGSLWMWGRNTNGQLGVNNITHRSSPVQTVAGGTNWKQVACGLSHTAAIKTDGTLWLWGYNGLGGLGNNGSTSVSSPVQTVSGGTNWKQVAGGTSHSAAIKTDGTLWTWGDNGNGQLGNNGSTSVSSPVQTVAGGTNWKQVSCGGSHTTAIKTNGTLWSWGYNFGGQIGDGTFTYQSSPVQTVAGGTNWKQVAGGTFHSAAIKTDGTLWTWGYNAYGELGISGVTHRSSPVQTVAGGTNWKAVAAGSETTSAIRDDSSDAFGNPL